jgi:hypothetical protein
MGLKRHPELDGKSATFWHFVTEGSIEADRIPVRERLERIAWPKAILVEAGNDPSRVLVWANERCRSTHVKSTRWIVALYDFSYVVVLDEREDYVLPWTAYPVAEDHRRRKLRRERASGGRSCLTEVSLGGVACYTPSRLAVPNSGSSVSLASRFFDAVMTSAGLRTRSPRR